MSHSKSGYPRLILTNPYSEIEVPDLHGASDERILREAEKYLTKEGKSRLLWACNKSGTVIREDKIQQKKKDKFSKRKKFKGKEDFDRVKWRMMKKFFTRIDNQKQHQGPHKPFRKPHHKFHGKKSGLRPIHSHVREGGHHGSQKR